MKKFKLFLFAVGLLSSVGLHAETTVIPHPFTVHDVGDDGRQVVYFSTDEPTRQQWQESFENDQQILSNLEWEYLLNNREFKGIAAANFRGWAQLLDEEVETKVIAAYAVLLPDDWAEMYHFDNTTSAWYKDDVNNEHLFNIGPSFDNNPLKAADKAALQQAGAVFLPCDISKPEGVYADGQYWTSTKEEGYGIYYAYFSTSSTTPSTSEVSINEGGKAEEERYVLLATREVTITLNENEDNTDLLKPWATHHQPVNVKLIRSLTPGMYNTLCLPFDLTAKKVREAFGENTKLAKFTSGTLSDDKTTLNIDFVDVDLSIDNNTAIVAGEPYLIQPDDVVTDPTFKQCVIEKTSADGENFTPKGAVEYLGIINPHHLTDGDKQYLFLQANNTLTWSKAGDTSSMKGMRGYFYVPDMVDMPSGCPARLSVRPAPQTPTELEPMRDARFTMHDGKFIINGHFVIIREGKTYNAQGQIIQ